ncbi:MAG: glycosyltransferase family 2 protein [Rhodobacter sp.]|nr:glycosyltransferase family 2 protein [Rhodobacter sp.]
MLERMFLRQDGALRPLALAVAFRRSDGGLRQPLRKLLVRKNGATRPLLPPRLAAAISAPWWKLWLDRYDTPPAGWPPSPGADHPPQAQGVLVLLCVDGQTDLSFLDRLQQCGGLQGVTNLTVVPRFTPDVADAVRQKARAYWPDAMPDDAPGRIILLDPRTLPRRHGLHLLLDALCRQTGAVLAFGDDMAIDRHGQVSDPWFKPGFDPLLAARGMLPGPMTALGLDRLRNPLAVWASLRGDNTEPDDPLMTVLAAVSRDEVLHCPHVVAFRFERAVRPRRQIAPPVPDPLPTVSIIIPTRDGWDLLGPCLDSLGRTDWPVAQREIIVVDNGSSDPACLAGLARAEAAGSVRVLRDPRPFNFAALNNRAASLARGELLVFLNNDTLALRPDWLGVLSAFAWLPGAGAVGPKLLYADGSVQHAGLVFGLNGRAVHVHVGLPSDGGGYQGLATTSHEVSGVTGACLALRRAAFEAVGGFNEGFPVAYNDMVLCADLMKKGYRNLYVAEPLFLHLESRTRGNLDNPEKHRREADEAARARALHPDLFAADPHYSPNLSLDAPYVPAVPPRRRPPWDLAGNPSPPAD